jgi:cell division septation protein DedD
MSERESEKELILGNSQLISLFFVVVALCGVFFALGYMIGRNSTRPVTAAVDGAAAPPPVATHDEAPPVETSPAPSFSATPEPAPMPSETKPAPAAVVETPKPAPVTTPPPAPTTTAEAAAPEGTGTWLQVAALRKDDATKLVKTLKEQDFPARLADSPKPDFFRVLVGPYHQTAQVADAKAKLKSLGFANAFVQK